MDSTLVSTVISTVISSLIAFIVAKEKSRAESSKTYKELVTSERIKWLNSLRESIAEYLAKSYYIYSYKSINNHDGTSFYNKAISQELYKLSYLVMLRLNHNQENHKRLIEKLNDLNGVLIDFLDGGEVSEEVLQEHEVAIEQFTKACQEVLKTEWDFVKKEATPFNKSNETKSEFHYFRF